MSTPLLLPQNDPDRQGRADDLAEMRDTYAYRYAYNDSIATAIEVPRSEYPDLHYKRQLLKNLAPLLLSLPRVLGQTLRSWSGKAVGDHHNYFFFANSPYPDRRFIRDFQSDREFGLQRVVGMNHLMTRALSAEETLPPGLPAAELEPLFTRLKTGQSLAEALAAGRLFLADYHPLQGLADDPGEFDGARQYITAPLALFHLGAEGSLLPVAIRLQQQAAPEAPLFGPHQGEHWQAAKLFMQAADGNYQEMISHATRIHYLAEALALASRRNLHRRHPLMALLDPHLSYTLKVNSGRLSLADKQRQPGTFGKLFGGSCQAMIDLMAESMRSFDFQANAHPVDLRCRGMDNSELFYPYRDDGQLIWKALQDFVEEYLYGYYAADQDLEADPELQAWAGEMGSRDGLRLNGFPTAISSIGQLRDTLTNLLFTLTARHSSIHFAQYQYAGYVPNMPLACYLPPPTDPDRPLEPDYLLKALPPFSPALHQSFIFYLTNFRVNRIGDYRMDAYDTSGQAAILRFRDKLREVGARIDAGDRKRLCSYRHLHPDWIPNGATI